MKYVHDTSTKSKRMVKLDISELKDIDVKSVQPELIFQMSLYPTVQGPLGRGVIFDQVNAFFGTLNTSDKAAIIAMLVDIRHQCQSKLATVYLRPCECACDVYAGIVSGFSEQLDKLDLNINLCDKIREFVKTTIDPRYIDDEVFGLTHEEQLDLYTLIILSKMLSPIFVHIMFGMKLYKSIIIRERLTVEMFDGLYVRKYKSTIDKLCVYIEDVCGKQIQESFADPEQDNGKPICMYSKYARLMVRVFVNINLLKEDHVRIETLKRIIDKR